MYHYGQNKFSMSTKSLLGSVEQRQLAVDIQADLDISVRTAEGAS